MLEYDWEESLGFWICVTSHEMRKALGPVLAQEGLTIRQWEVLACLSARGIGCQAELADHLSIEPNTLAGVLDRMQKAGWLERRPCEEDRRRKRLYPTGLAEAVWKRVTDACHAMRSQVTTGLTAEDVTNLKRILAKIRENVSAVTPPQSIPRDVA